MPTHDLEVFWKTHPHFKRRWDAHKNAAAHTVDSRQQFRARLRREAFMEITKKYGFEPRHARRGIALTIARKWFHESRITNHESQG
jgi:hypothetical protein